MEWRIETEMFLLREGRVPQPVAKASIHGEFVHHLLRYVTILCHVPPRAANAVVRAFFNTLFVSLGLPMCHPILPAGLNALPWSCASRPMEIASSDGHNRHSPTDASPFVARPSKNPVDEAYTSIRADTLTTRLVGTSAD